MTIPTCNCFPSLVTEGLGNYLKTASIQGVKIRILLPKDERSLELKNYLEKQHNSKNLEIKQVEDIRAKRIMVLVDNLHSLVMEMKEIAKEDSLIKSAVYSASAALSTMI
jgi:hypothetical protein